MHSRRASLIIPVYNRPEMIVECLESLVPGLDDLLEVLIIDDGSTDGKTTETIEATIEALGVSNKIRLIKQVNAGPGSARNKGADIAQGDWLFFLDSDDLWLPWSAQAMHQALDEHPEAHVMFLKSHPFQEESETEDWSQSNPNYFLFETFYSLSEFRPRPNPLGAGYFAITRELFLENGGFAPKVRGSEDTDLFFRIAANGPFLLLTAPIIVARRASNADSLTVDMTAVIEGLDYILERNRDNFYSEGHPGDLERRLADMFRFYIQELFWGGYGRAGYRFLLRRGVWGMLWRTGQGKTALKLLAYPVLSVVRPRNYHFSFNSKHARRR